MLHHKIDILTDDEEMIDVIGASRQMISSVAGLFRLQITNWLRNHRDVIFLFSTLTLSLTWTDIDLVDLFSGTKLLTCN